MNELIDLSARRDAAIKGGNQQATRRQQPRTAAAPGLLDLAATKARVFVRALQIKHTHRWSWATCHALARWEAGQL